MEKTFILKLIIQDGWEESIILGKKYEKIEVKDNVALPIRFHSFLKEFIDESINMYPFTNLFIISEDGKAYPIENMNYEKAYITCDGNTIEKLPILVKKESEWVNYWIDVMKNNPAL